MISLETEIKELQKELTNKNIKRLLNKLFKTRYKAGAITKREYKQGKKMVVNILRRC